MASLSSKTELYFCRKLSYMCAFFFGREGGVNEGVDLMIVYLSLSNYLGLSGSIWVYLGLSGSIL